MEGQIFVVRTTVNKEDQVVDFLISNIERKKLDVYSILRPHGMKGYIFVEAGNVYEVEKSLYGVPYQKGLLKGEVEFDKIEKMIKVSKQEINLSKNDIVEIINGPFKKEKCKITRIDKGKEEILVEFLDAAVPIPINVKIDDVKIIKKDKDDDERDSY